MNINDNIEKLIEGYLNDNLSIEEAAAFEKIRQQNPEISRELKLREEIDAALQDKKALKLEADLKNLGHIHSQKYEKSPSRINKVWILIGILVFVGISTFIVTKLLSNHNVNYYAEYYEPYNFSDFKRSTDESPQSSLNKAIQSYNLGDYDLTFSKLEAILKLNDEFENDNKIKFLQAQTLLALERKTEAKEYLMKLSSENNHEYYLASRWYLALVELNQNNTEKAIINLNKILEVSANGKYANLAKTLLKKLK